MATVKDVQFGTLSAIEVSKASGAKVQVALYGGTVTSYKDANGHERLFMSEEALRDGTKPIRGGVPLVFPQFGDGQGKYPQLPSHGFARRSTWTFQGSSPEGDSTQDAATNADGSVTFYLTLTDSQETRAVWDWPFKLTYKVTFDDFKLDTSMSVSNTGTESFEFQCLLHTYYKLQAVENIGIEGLQGLSYIDQLQGRKIVEEKNEKLKIDKETDWIYTKASKVSVDNGFTKVGIMVSLNKDGEAQPCDAVVWNPWINKSKGMGDFGDEEYHVMTCVEPGCVSRFEACTPGSTWTLTQEINFA